MHPDLHQRALHALYRSRRYKRLRVHEMADYGALLDLASRPHPRHELHARAAGFDPARVGVVVYEHVTRLSEALGMSRNAENLPKRLARYVELGMAVLRPGAIILRPGAAIRLDDHRAAYETDASLWDGQPFPPVTLPGRRGPAVAGEAGGQLGLAPLGSCGDQLGSPQDHETIYRDQKMEMGGAPARPRYVRSTRPAAPTPEGFDEILTLVNANAAVDTDGRRYQVSAQAGRFLASVIERHGLDACRAALTQIAPRYIIRHPVGWLAGVLDDPKGAGLSELEQRVLECVPEPGRGQKRGLADAERQQLAQLVERHGPERVEAALPGAAGCSLPVSKLRADLDRPKASGAKGGRSKGSPPEDFPWRKRKEAERQREEAEARAAERAELLESACSDLELRAVIAAQPARCSASPPRMSALCLPDAGAAATTCQPAAPTGGGRCADVDTAPEPALRADPQAAAAWAEGADALRAQVTPENWRRYFAVLVAVGVDAGGRVVLDSADPMHAEWVGVHYAAELEQAGAVVARADWCPPPDGGWSAAQAEPQRRAGLEDEPVDVDKRTRAEAALGRLVSWARAG